MADNGQERTEKNTQAYAALGVAFVCIVIGVPLWWKTTEVYRVGLPDGDIQHLADIPVTYQSSFSVVIFEEKWNRVQLSLLGKELREQMESSLQSDLHYQYKGNIRDATQEEKALLHSVNTLDELDKQFSKLQVQNNHGVYHILALPQKCKFDPGNGLIGNSRSIFVKVEDVKALVPLVQHIVKDVIVDEVGMNRIYHTAMASKTLKPDKESMRGLRYHPGYDLTFTLLNPQPDVLDARWDMDRAINTYLKPLIKAVEDYCTITAKSQYLYYTNLSIRPKKSKKGDFFILSQDELPHIINPIEAHLNSHVSTNPNLNFIVYVPTRDQNPLHILDDAGNPAGVDAFLSPRWGGMMVHNMASPGANDSLPLHTMLDMQTVMEVFISQLRLLLGITKTVSIMGVDVSQPGNAAISDWELDKWLRSRTVENVATATATLKSLTQLLNEVSNIVINDDIGREVQRAVANIEQSHKFLKQGKLQQAFITSRQAMLSSEKAFFDPSLLELLYFPEDQKFAIYIPLFLPISIPVLLSLLQSIKWLRTRNKVQAEPINK